MTFTLNDLERIIRERATAPVEESYTAKLLSRGTPKVAQKVGEEAVEVVIEALLHNKERLIYETADLLYHLGVLLHDQGVLLQEVYDELEKRWKEKGGAV